MRRKRGGCNRSDHNFRATRRSRKNTETEKRSDSYIRQWRLRQREKVGFIEKTALRHRRGGGREVTVTSKLHTQEYRDIELNIVIDEIGPGEGLLDSGGIEIPLKPAGKGGVAQFPAGSPVQATTCGQSWTNDLSRNCHRNTSASVSDRKHMKSLTRFTPDHFCDPSRHPHTMKKKPCRIRLL